MIARGFSFSFLLIPSIMTAELQFTTNSHSCASLTNLSRSREDAQRDFTFGILSRKIKRYNHGYKSEGGSVEKG